MADETMFPGSDDPIAQKDIEIQAVPEESLMLDMLSRLGFSITENSETDYKNTATLELNGHQITVDYTYRKAFGYDAKISLDNNQVAANNDFRRSEFLIYIKDAMAMATFNAEHARIPTWTDEYTAFSNSFNDKVK